MSHVNSYLTHHIEHIARRPAVFAAAVLLATLGTLAVLSVALLLEVPAAALRTTATRASRAAEQVVHLSTTRVAEQITSAR